MTIPFEVTPITELAVDQKVRIAALQVAVQSGDRRLQSVLRRASYIEDWIYGAEIADLDVPDDL